MVEKKTEKKTNAKVKTKKTKASKTTKSKDKSTKSKTKKAKEEPFGDSGIVIVDDELEIDQEKVNEERRAYLEEAKSQDVSD